MRQNGTKFDQDHKIEFKNLSSGGGWTGALTHGMIGGVLFHCLEFLEKAGLVLKCF
jgi:hypothetical protein